MSSLLLGFEPLRGPLQATRNGSLIASEAGSAVTFGLAQGAGPGPDDDRGWHRGLRGHGRRHQQPRRRSAVNVCREKQMTNIRSSTSDIAVRLTPPVRFSLEESLDFLAADELLEVTPKMYRIRKRVLGANAARPRRQARVGVPGIGFWVIRSWEVRGQRARDAGRSVTPRHLCTPDPAPSSDLARRSTCCPASAPPTRSRGCWPRAQTAFQDVEIVETRSFGRALFLDGAPAVSRGRRVRLPRGAGPPGPDRAPGPEARADRWRRRGRDPARGAPPPWRRARRDGRHRRRAGRSLPRAPGRDAPGRLRRSARGRGRSAMRWPTCASTTSRSTPS